MPAYKLNPADKRLLGLFNVGPVVERFGEGFVDFASTVLYIIESRLVSMDRAFHLTKRALGLEAPLKDYYNAVLDIVRNYAYLQFASRIMFGTVTRKSIVKAWLAMHGDSHYARRLRKRARASLDAVESGLGKLKDEDPVQYLSVRYSFPRNLVEALLGVLDQPSVEELLKSLNRRVLWLRVNTLKADLDKVVKAVEGLGIEFVQHRDFPFMLMVTNFKGPYGRTRLFKEGILIPQDISSVLTVLNLKPQEGDVILDACAAPGMKTSLIMQLTENNAEVYAVDVSRRRVERMVRVLKWLGVDYSKVHVIRADSTRLSIVGGSIDKALIDAPCTSSGAISKDPGVKLMLEAKWGLVKYYSDIQKEILLNVLNNLKAGSEVVYATCSILPQEGEEVVEYASSKAPIRLVKPDVGGLVDGYGKYSVSRSVGRTMPHIHNGEGFFISRIIKE